MLNLMVSQEVKVVEADGLTTWAAVVAKVGKRTAIVNLENGASRKFVLTDGRESGQGYKCAHVVELGVPQLAESLSDKFMESEFTVETPEAVEVSEPEGWSCEKCGTTEIVDRDTIVPSLCWDCAVEAAKEEDEDEDPEVVAFKEAIGAE